MSAAGVPAPPEPGHYPPPGSPPPRYRSAPVGTRPWWLLLAAGMWSTGLLAAALLISPSLVQVNGTKVLVPVGAPLAVVVMVALALALARHRPWRWPTVVAWVLAGLLDCLVLVGMLTIGVFVLPAAIAVTMACSLP